jgi:hypothetical protein
MKNESPVKKVTREYLLAHGFNRSPNAPDAFTLEGVCLGEVARRIGFAIPSLRPLPNAPPDRDVRTVTFGDCRFVIESRPMHGPNRRIIRLDLVNPNVICDVRASFRTRVASRPMLRTDGSPCLRIKSVSVPRDRKQPIQIDVEVSTDGKMPLGIEGTTFSVCLFDNEDCVFIGETTVSMPARQPIIVDPGKLVHVKVSASANSRDGRLWSDLAPREYVLRVAVGTTKRREPCFDYEWVGKQYPCKIYSDGYVITVGENAR